ncbi:T9SS type A sorting domain-containing protein [bacterium]|nr:T9SS type A sorting domain-containing protein [bacterium]
MSHPLARPGSPGGPRPARAIPLGVLLTVLLTVLLGVLFATAAVAQPDCVDYADHLRWLGAVPTGGSARDLALLGDHGYLANGGAGFAVLDLAEPTEPAVVFTDPAAGTALWLTVHEGHAYVGNIDSELLIYDLAVPTSPALVATLAIDGGDALDFAVRGHLMLVAAGHAGLLVVDVGNPAAPVVVGSLATPGIARGVAVDGDLVAVAGDQAGVLMVDLAVPQQPRALGAVGTDDAAVAVDLEGGTVLAAARSQGLVVIDATVPSAPQITATLPLLGEARDVVRRDDGLAFVASLGLAVVDVALPDQPFVVGRVSTLREPISVALAAGLAYLPAGDAGLDLYDIDPPISPPTLSRTPVEGVVFGVATTGPFTLVGAEDLTVVDHTDPTAPVVRGELAFTGTTSRVAAEGEVAYLTTAGTGYGNLLVIDVADPDAPVQLGELAFDGFPSGALPAGDLVYLADFLYGGLFVVDVSRPTQPDLVAELPTRPFAQQLARVGQHLLVGTGSFGDGYIQIFGLADPTLPAFAGEFPLAGRGVNGFAVDGDRVYATVKQGDPYRLVILDAADPANMELLGGLYVPDIAHGVQARGDVVYLSTFLGYLYVIDVSDPTAPVVIGETFLPDSAFVLAMTEGALHAAATDAGLILLPHHCDDTVAIEPPADDGSDDDTPPAGLAAGLTAYPNPFNPRVTLAFTLARAGSASLVVYDAAGRRVAELRRGPFAAGRHTVVWDGRDAAGRALPSGHYLARLQTERRVATARLVLVR